MEKTYKIDKHTLKQGKLLLGQARDVVKLVRQLDFDEAGDDVVNLVDQLFDSGLVDDFMDVVLTGDRPDSPATDWMPLETAVEVVRDFLSLNSGLFRMLSDILPDSLNLKQMTPSESLTAKKTKVANSPSTKT